MEIPHLNKTELNDRILWFDGDSTFSEENLVQLMSSGHKIDGFYIDRISNDIKQFNALVQKSQRITIKESVSPLSFKWNIPIEYEQINIEEYTKSLLENDIANKPTNEQQKRIERVDQELKLFDQLSLDNILRILIYIINTLQRKNIVWGVGRGSSVSSYILYLFKVHDVDSVKYDLPITEFIRHTT